MTESSPPLSPPQSLKSQVFNSSIWTLSGYTAAQLLHLASNIILAKLLFPEAFGLMLLVSIFMQGLTMFSDLGIVPGIIQNERGEEPIFLNTAWTIQVIRGVILWLIACAGAYPYAMLYDEPLLAAMLPVAGLTAIIAGFNSTALATANRRLNLSRITVLELIAQFTSTVVMILWVMIHPTVWGLVAGGITSALVKMILSHVWLGEIKNRLFWDGDAARKLIKFGRWILVSTALTFFARHLGRLLLGFLMGTATLGVYSIAVLFSNSASSALQMLGNKVLFPSYSKIIRTADQAKLYSVLRKTRLIMIAGSWLSSLVLITLGAYIIDILYDERYSAAVWMIQILPLGTLVGILSLTYGNVLLAQGRSAVISALLAIQISIQISAVLLGYFFGDIKGIILGLTFATWIIYPMNAYAVHKIKLWQPEIDFPVLLLAVGFVLLYLPQLDITI